MIDYGLFMVVYKPSKLIYSSVHIDRVYHFIQRSFFTNTIIIRISVLTDPFLEGPVGKSNKKRNQNLPLGQSRPPNCWALPSVRRTFCRRRRRAQEQPPLQLGFSGRRLPLLVIGIDWFPGK